MKMPAIKGLDIKLPALPKKVMISIGVIGTSIILFAVLYFTLGAATEQAELDVTRLKGEISGAQTKVRQSKENYDFVLANQDRFEVLMRSDKLIPHTRRTAVRQMQALALEFGLTALNYNFQAAGGQAPDAVSNQPKTGDYKVYVETIDLTLGSPLDQNMYSFIAALHDDFPGSMVLAEFEFSRAPALSNDALNLVSRGEDSKLVQGKIKYSWRTAQKQDQKK
jgi:hypothetical protein